jgi:Flp pilus assembly protein TadG
MGSYEMRSRRNNGASRPSAADAHTTGGRSRRRGRGERGASLVEAAIVTPLVFLLVFGVLEAGYAFFGKLTVDNMSVVGTRAASGQANEVLSDYKVLRAVEHGSSTMSPSTINLIVVYKATGPGGSVPASCKTASVTGLCNRYTGADLALAEDQFGCVGPPGPTSKKDAFWCPTTRKTALQGTGGPPDYVGVYVEGVHDNLIGFFGASFTFTAENVIRIEPRSLR